MRAESTIRVTFYKTYDIDLSQVCGKLNEVGYEDVQMTEELIKQKAEEMTREWLLYEMTREWLSDEMEIFSNNTHDFISATVEILN